MVNTGGYKAENGFESGYLLHLESVLKETLLDSNILANPRIASRMKTLRKDWQVVFDIKNSSCFGYSKERNCVTADDAVWDAYIEKHPDASKWKNKKFPYFEELYVIFGNDRAQGSKARVAYEMEDEINVEEQQMNV